MAFDKGSYFWDKLERIKRQASKPGRQAVANRPREELARLLTLKYKVLERTASGEGRPVDAEQATFNIGDQLRISLTPNQHGYLYVLHHSVDNNNHIVDQPQIIFPSPRINVGKNEVNKDETYVVPKFCPEFADPKDCWLQITGPAGHDFLTVIFSREKITYLPNSLSEADITAKAKDIVALQTLEALNKEKDANKGSLARTREIRFKSKRTTDEDGVFIQNTNRNNNEQIIDTIELWHPSEAKDEAAHAQTMFAEKRADAMRVQFLKGSREVDPADVFHANDEVRVRFESNFNGYVYMVNITPAGEKRVIFPCARTTGVNLLPEQIKTVPMSFDQEKGTEVLQVIMSRERIAFFESAIKEDCCENPEKCALSAATPDAAAELAAVGRQQRGGVKANVVPVLLGMESSGVRRRGIDLAQGGKGSTYVAVKGSGKLEQGNYAVFEIRLNHN
ncbi:MAG TPA: DUF4384 domain-containing protein [Blastocatellia bacterium]|nr:DUF4384 domain-containing protein [Blastocatellia bacterium]